MKVDFPSEKDIEDYVQSAIERDGRCPMSDFPVHICHRQYEIVGYGITDLIKITALQNCVNITVTEFKNETLKAAHVEQLCRYMTGIKRIVNKYKRHGFCVALCGELAGPYFQNGKPPNDLIYLKDFLPQNIFIYDLSLTYEHGFKATEINGGWFRTSENYLAYRDVAKEIYNEFLYKKACQKEKVVPIKGRN